jgi:hypothetical protein
MGIVNKILCILNSDNNVSLGGQLRISDVLLQKRGPDIWKWVEPQSQSRDGEINHVYVTNRTPVFQVIKSHCSVCPN